MKLWLLTAALVALNVLAWYALSRLVLYIMLH